MRSHTKAIAWLAVAVLTAGLPPCLLVKPAQAQEPAPTDERARQGAGLISEAFDLADTHVDARVAALRGAAALLPRLPEPQRGKLTERWLNLAISDGVPRQARLDAYSSFFDEAAHFDPAFGEPLAAALMDPSGRTAAYISLSEVADNTSWDRADAMAIQAQNAARQEPDLLLRAEDLNYVAYRMAILDPAERENDMGEATATINMLPVGHDRDTLMADAVGAAAKFDLVKARAMAATISDPDLRGLAEARANISEISQSTLTGPASDRIAALAKASVRYDQRAIPILLQLPPQEDVLKALADSLPQIYPTAPPLPSAQSLERLWAYAGTADPSVYRDELQSRLARLMVLHDPWLGRSWGKRLAWKGGRIQVGAFLKAVLLARDSHVQAGALQDLAMRDIRRALMVARALPPAASAEALLLIAGQVLT